MADLYAHTDYREYLLQLFEERKQKSSWYSYRLWASQIGLDSAQLFRILSKDLHLPLKYLDTLIQDLNLKKADAEYFRTLVQWGRAKTDKEKNALVEKLLGCRDVKRKTLNKEQYLFFKDWYHTTVRSLVGADAYHGNAQALGQKILPAISAAEVQKSIDLQLELGLLQKSGKQFQLGNTHLSTNENEVNRAIRQYQAQMLQRGAEALERFQKKDRDFSTLTFAVDATCVEDIRAILTECRRQIQRRIEESKTPDRVMHLNMNLFPTGFVGEVAPWKEETT